MEFGRLAWGALACWALYGATVARVHAQPLPRGMAVDTSALEVGPESQAAIPGPGWLADDPALTGGFAPPTQDGWSVAYPFKYFPQGQTGLGGEEYSSCLLPAEAAEQCYCMPPPCYFGTFYFDVVILDRRSNLEAMDLYFDSTGAPVLNTADFNFETEAGIRLGFLFASPCGNDWIGEYFGIRSFQDSITRTDAAGVSDLFFGETGTSTSLTAEYESNLDSLEFSVRSRQTCRLALLAGVRFIQVDEMFNSLQDPVGRQGWFSQSDNDWVGFQFGVQGLIFEHGPWRMETIAKAGPYLNDIDIDVRVNPPGQNNITKHVSHWHTAFAGDLRLGVIYRVGLRLSLRAGYQALWLEGLALAPNQNNNISVTTNLESVDLSGVIYQGGNIGFEFSW